MTISLVVVSSGGDNFTGSIKNLINKLIMIIALREMGLLKGEVHKTYKCPFFVDVFNFMYSVKELSFSHISISNDHKSMLLFRNIQHTFFMFFFDNYLCNGHLHGTFWHLKIKVYH